MHFGFLPTFDFGLPACLPIVMAAQKNSTLGEHLQIIVHGLNSLNVSVKCNEKATPLSSLGFLSLKNHICVDNKAALICSAYSIVIIEIQHQNNFLSADQ